MEWYPWRNLGFGAEYAYTRIVLNDEQDSYIDNLDFEIAWFVSVREISLLNPVIY